MKLYYSPGACSLAPHIVLREAGYAFDLVKVDLGSKKTADGDDYRKVNPNGYVPALQLDSGDVLTEGPAITQYLADQKPAANLAPANGTLPRYQLQSWLNFITSELHKAFGMLFNPKTPAEAREQVIAKVTPRLELLDKTLSAQPFLTGSTFTIADAYLFTVLNWAPMVKVDLSKYAALGAFSARVGGRPTVQAALKAEGLIK